MDDNVKQYAYSFDGEMYEGEFDSVKKALEEARSREHRKVWVGELVKINPVDHFDVDDFIERLDENILDEFTIDVDTSIYVGDKDGFEAKIRAIITEHIDVLVYNIDNAKEFDDGLSST